MKILFISHNVSRTGAPVLLLRLARELAMDGTVELGFLTGEDGPLAEPFRQIGTIRVWKPTRVALPARLLDFFFRKTGLNAVSTAQRHKRSVKRYCEKYDIIVSNTTWTIGILKELGLTGKVVIPYIHELQIMTGLRATPDDMRWLSDVSAMVLVPCNYVKEFLARRYLFDKGKIRILPYIVPLYGSTAETTRDPKPDVFRLGACGTLDWRKGYDIFLQIAIRLCRSMGLSDIRLEWVGADLSSVEYCILMNDIEKSGMSPYVTIHGPTEQIADHFARWDLFLLTSREDPFPLVVQEAAALGVPAICFNEAGGIMEFLQDGGIAVDYLNIDQFCTAIADLRNDRARLKKMAESVKKRFSEYNDPKAIADTFLSYCEEPSK